MKPIHLEQSFTERTQPVAQWYIRGLERRSQTLQVLLFILCVRLHFLIMNLRHLPTSANFPQDIISHIQVVHRLQVKSMHSLINYLRQKLEAFQSVHHVTFILCYTVLYVFLGLRCRFGRHRAEVHRTSCALVFALIRVRKHWWDDITQGKQ